MKLITTKTNHHPVGFHLFHSLRCDSKTGWTVRTVAVRLFHLYFLFVDGELFTYTLKQPVGVAGLILPWNGPIFIFIAKVCTALAAGNFILRSTDFKNEVPNSKGAYPLEAASGRAASLRQLRIEVKCVTSTWATTSSQFKALPRWYQTRVEYGGSYACLTTKLYKKKKTVAASLIVFWHPKFWTHIDGSQRTR